MSNRSLLIGAATALLCAGCANGWPHTHHLAQPKTVNTCTPIGSRIARSGCDTSTPASSTTQAEYDRQGLGTGGTALQAPTLIPR